MDDLNFTINEIRDKIKNHRGLYEKNEQMVRTQLIDPLLYAVGWNSGDPEKVQTNVKTDLGYLDYLLKKRSKNVLIIEAKNLGVDVNKKIHLRQILPYCSDANVKYCLITNGLNWILFEPNKERTRGNEKTERTLWSMNISQDDKKIISLFFKMISPQKIDKITEGLEQLHREKRLKERIQKRMRASLEKKQNILEDSWKNLLRNQSGIKEAIGPLFTTYLNKNKSKRDTFSQREISAFLLEKIRINFISDQIRKPKKGLSDNEKDHGLTTKRLIIKNSPAHSIEKSKQYEILTFSANWLIKKGKLRASDCPITVAHGNKFLVNTKPVHEDGSQFRGGHKLENGLWIDTAFNESTKIEYAKRLFEECGVPGDTIRVE
jgi:predicted type IV restriction endonuclease